MVPFYILNYTILDMGRISWTASWLAERARRLFGRGEKPVVKIVPGERSYYDYPTREVVASGPSSAAHETGHFMFVDSLPLREHLAFQGFLHIPSEVNLFEWIRNELRSEINSGKKREAELEIAERKLDALKEKFTQMKYSPKIRYILRKSEAYAIASQIRAAEERAIISGRSVPNLNPRRLNWLRDEEHTRGYLVAEVVVSAGVSIELIPKMNERQFNYVVSRLYPKIERQKHDIEGEISDLYFKEHGVKGKTWEDAEAEVLERRNTSLFGKNSGDMAAKIVKITKEEAHEILRDAAGA